MEPIERIPVVIQVMQNLERLITERNLKPGDQMPTEKEVCQLFGVGRSTVREAYKMLQVQGKLQSRQGKGSFLTDTDHGPSEYTRNWFKEHSARITDYMEVRLALEPTAIRLAAARATPAELEQIEALHADFCEAANQQNAIAMATFDEQFHAAVTRAAHNTLLNKLQEDISGCFRDYRIRSFAVQQNAVHAIEPHRAILDALRKRDGQAGEEAVRHHLQISLQDMKEILES